MKKFWKLANSVDSSGSELILDGPISDESWWGDEVTPQALRDELKSMTGNTLTVVLNSGGGDVFAGMSIYNALRELDKEVTVRVDGLAASIASIIAMAGDKIVMSPGTMMMIHKPSVLAMGNTEELTSAIEMLKVVEDSIVPIYVDRTGLTTEEVTSLMEAETWMSAEKAVELGFADSVLPTVKKTETADAPTNAFSGKFAFSMSATKASLDSFVSKVTASEETEEITPKVVEPVVVEQPTEPVTAPAPKTEETVEPPVEENNSKSTKEKETKMEDDNKTIAMSQVLAPADQATVEVKAKVSDYLKSKNSVEDYANILVANAGRESKDVQAAWSNHLTTTMGITNPEILLPQPIIQSIKDAFAEGGQLWNLVNKTGLDVFSVAWDTVTGDDSRARGHKRGTDKNEEVITLADRTLRPQYIYKYLTLNKEDVRENRSTGALLRYVMSELPKRIIREIERAIVIGDGRANNSNDKISSFISLKADTAANNTFASTYTPVAGDSSAESVAKAKDLLLAPGTVVMIAKKGYSTAARFEKDTDNKLLFPLGTKATDVFDIDTIIEPDWFTDATDADNDAYLFVASAYNAVGDDSIEAFTNFLLKSNKNEYLQEIYQGGGLADLKAAVAIAKAPVVEA